MGRLNVELWVKGAVITVHDTETLVDDINPTSTAPAFDSISPPADGVTLTDGNTVEFAFGNTTLTSHNGWTAGDNEYTYTGEVIPTLPLTGEWQLSGIIEVSVANFGYSSNIGSGGKAYLGLGDPTTDFIGIKVEWLLSVILGGSVSIYMCKVFAGTENNTLLQEVTDSGDGSTFATLTGTFTLKCNPDGSYTAELQIGTSAPDSRTTTLSDPIIRIYTEDSLYNRLDGLIQWKNVSRS